MAIYIIEGRPGSGKTYYAVYHMTRKYFVYDSSISEYISKIPVLIVSNIDSLKLDHVNLDVAIREKGFSYVFSEKYLVHLRDEYKVKSIVFLIDEAQRYFDRKFYDKDVFFFFQYSRHYGLDVYLITQDVDSLAKELRNLAEYYIRAVPRSLGSGIGFRYKFIYDGEVLRTVHIKKDPKIFALYKSFDYDELEKPKVVYVRFLVYFFVLLFTAVLGYKFLFSSMFRAVDRSDKVAAQKVGGNVSSSSKIKPKVFFHEEKLSSGSFQSDRLNSSSSFSSQTSDLLSHASGLRPASGVRLVGVLGDLFSGKSYVLVEQGGSYNVFLLDYLDDKLKKKLNPDRNYSFESQDVMRAYFNALLAYCNDNPASSRCSFYASFSSSGSHSSFGNGYSDFLVGDVGQAKK